MFSVHGQCVWAQNCFIRPTLSRPTEVVTMIHSMQGLPRVNRANQQTKMLSVYQKNERRIYTETEYYMHEPFESMNQH